MGKFGSRVTGKGDAPPRTTMANRKARYLGDFPPEHSESLQRKIDAEEADKHRRGMKGSLLAGLAFADDENTGMHRPSVRLSHDDVLTALANAGLGFVYWDQYAGEYVNEANGKRATGGSMFNDEAAALAAIKQLTDDLREQGEAAGEFFDEKKEEKRDDDYRGLTPEQAELLREMDAA